MKISIKHNNTEIVVDDSDGTTIEYSTAELMKVIEKMSLEIQEIESNYNEIIEKHQPLPIGVGGCGFINVGLQTCAEFVVDTINSSATKCMRCNMEKWQHPSKSIIAGM